MREIEAEDLSFSYEKGNRTLDHLSFFVQKGESVGLIGANGAGKSTLLKLLVGLRLDYEGMISIGSLTVEKKNLPQIRSKLGYVFQDSDSQLFMSTVYEDVAFAPRNYGISRAETDARVKRALELTGITQLQDRRIHTLSGGEKKLASIATILSMEPQMLLLDEPSVALDPKNRRKLIHILNDLPQTKLIASHDLDLILETCDRVILLSEGRIAADGPAKELLRDQALLEANGLELPLCLQGILQKNKFFC